MDLVANSSTSTPVEWADAPLERRWVAKLFGRLGAQFGSKLADLFDGIKDETVQAEWALGLAGYTPDELSRGLVACSDRQFAPVLGEFKRLCRPALDPEYAWHEAQEGLQARERGELGVWSHPAVFRAASRMQHELRTQSFHSVRRRWEMVLNREFAAGWGDDVPAPPERIEHKPVLRPIPAGLKGKLADLGRTFRSKQ